MIEQSTPFREAIRAAGLRATRQRMALAELIFGSGHRHISAEQLHGEARAADIAVSLATIYNTLHQFTEAGLLREILVDPRRSYFDTNTSVHPHLYFEDDGRVEDIPSTELERMNLPQLPEGMRVSAIDMVVRVRRTEAA